MGTFNPQIQRIIERFGLSPHPEGGYYREVYRSPLHVTHEGLAPGPGRERRRCTATHIYFLLPAGDFSAFHRVVCSDEIWHVYAGGPLELHLIHEDGRCEKRVLTTDPTVGEPTTVVEAGCWQAAVGAEGCGWVFGGCTVAPGFEFADFEMPAASDLTGLHGQHEAVIRRLMKK